MLLHVAVAEAIYQGEGDVAAPCATAILHEVDGKIAAGLIDDLKARLGRLELPDDVDLSLLDTAVPAG
jgi:hypothetical protein